MFVKLILWFGVINLILYAHVYGGKGNFTFQPSREIICIQNLYPLYVVLSCSLQLIRLLSDEWWYMQMQWPRINKGTSLLDQRQWLDNS